MSHVVTAAARIATCSLCYGAHMTSITHPILRSLCLAAAVVILMLSPMLVDDMPSAIAIALCAGGCALVAMPWSWSEHLGREQIVPGPVMLIAGSSLCVLASALLVGMAWQASPADPRQLTPTWELITWQMREQGYEEVVIRQGEQPSFRRDGERWVSLLTTKDKSGWITRRKSDELFGRTTPEMIAQVPSMPGKCFTTRLDRDQVYVCERNGVLRVSLPKTQA